MGFHSKARVTKSRSIARVTAPPTPQIFSPTGASLVVQGGQVVAGGVTANPTGAQLVAQGGTVVYGGINARPIGASLVTQGGTPIVGWHPFLISGISHWYGAQYISGLNDGDAISSIADQVGSADMVTGNAPTYKTAIQNGQPVARFDGSNNYLKATISSLTQPYSIFYICKKTTAAASNKLLFAGTGFNGGLLQSSTVWQFYCGNNGLNVSSPDTAWHLFVGIGNGASSHLYIDGTDHTGNAGTNATGTTYAIGADATGANNADIDFGELGLISGAIGASDLASLLTYSQGFWGTP